MTWNVNIEKSKWNDAGFYKIRGAEMDLMSYGRELLETILI